LELSCTGSERSNVERDSSRLSVSSNNNIVGISNSESRESPVRSEFIINVWNSSLEGEARRPLSRCRPGQQDRLAEVELGNVGVSVSDIHIPTTTWENWFCLEFRTNGGWVDDTSWRKERCSGYSDFLEADIDWTTEGVRGNCHPEVGRGRLHIESDSRGSFFVFDGGNLNVTLVVVQLKTTIVAKKSGTADTISLGSSIINCDSTSTVVGAAGYGITWASANGITISVAVSTVFTSGNVTNAITTDLSTGNNFTRS
jgi:hypothetical protein